LPDPKYQELAVSGVETLVSTRLEPGIDPILEADKRGTILLILRVGAIDLEMPGLDGPGSDSGAAAGAVLPPGALPPGFTPTPPPAPGTIILDRAPAAAAPAPAPVYTPTAPAPPMPAPTIPPVPAVVPRGARS
jgi:hypothetical protein